MANLHLRIPEASKMVALTNIQQGEKKGFLRRIPESPAVEFTALTSSEAEEFLMRLWYVLEEHTIITPEMKIDFESDDSIHLQFLFSHFIDFIIVADTLDKYY